MPIQHCLLGDALFTNGIGTLMIVRDASPHRLWLASFLLDGYCLGVKDVFLRETDGDKLDAQLELVSVPNRLASVEPSYARKLLRDLVNWSDRSGTARMRTSL